MANLILLMTLILLILASSTTTTTSSISTSSSCFTFMGSHGTVIQRKRSLIVSTFRWAKKAPKGIGNEDDDDDTSSRRNPIQNKKKKKNNIRPSGGGGFGGASASTVVSDCPCGSGLSYRNCCYILHTSSDAYANATAAQVVRARYTAFALPTVTGTNFIVSSTHCQHKDFNSIYNNIDQFHRDISKKTYKLISCKILEENYYYHPSNQTNNTSNSQGNEEEEAVVKFIVQLSSGGQKHNKEKSAFLETSTFRKTEPNGPWLYLDGIVEDASLS